MYCSVAALPTSVHVTWHAAGTQQMLGDTVCPSIWIFTEPTMRKAGGFSGDIESAKEACGLPKFT